MSKINEQLSIVIEKYNLEKLDGILKILTKKEYSFTTKKEYRNEIEKLFDSVSSNEKRDILAKCYWLEKIWENRYINYDSNMFFSNADLYYICNLSDNWKINISSKWFWTKKELKEYFSNLKK